MTGRRLEGKVAIVTGAGGGMGRGYALHLASLGADIAILDKDLDVGRRNGEYAEGSVADEVRSLGQRAIAVQADLSNRAEATAAVDRPPGNWARSIFSSTMPAARSRRRHAALPRLFPTKISTC